MRRPLNRFTRRIYVAATRMNDGKTTTCLGLFHALRTRTDNVGFIKPIGQRFVEVDGFRIDEDSVLLDRIFQTRVPLDAMSPIAVDSTFTRRYLDDPAGLHPELVDQLSRAFDRAAYLKDYIIIEGTGHAGVGSVFDLSNARVANLLDAKAILVARGGIGSPVDEIAINKALFDKEGVEVIGAVLNKVVPEKADLVRTYAGKALERMGVPLLGVVPSEELLASPTLYQIARSLRGQWLIGRETGENRRVGRVVIGAMTPQTLMDLLHPDTLLITPGDREELLLTITSQTDVRGESPIAGIVLTRGLTPSRLMLDMLQKANIPVMLADGESYEVASRINTMTVKTRPGDTEKINLIRRTIQANVDLDRICESFT
ncbi:MAG: phosphotransacetylase family protein [Opitutales bacterium]